MTVLVANRGEIAVRIVRAVHELGGRAVLVRSADDADPAPVARADGTVELPGTGTAAYLDQEAVLAAAHAAGATALHPGYGFLSEHAEFARACGRAGLTFVGPSPEVLDLFGDKGRARAHAIARGVPVLPGTSGPTSVEEAAAFAAEHAAVMIKAVAGGGGRGMRRVLDPADLAAAHRAASVEADAAFGDGAVYVEKLLPRPRHVEVQVVGDHTGRVLALGERDCSIQRRHQKLVEVAPSPWLAADLRAALVDAALHLTADLGYAGLGTVEFLVEDGAFWFLEVNPRLQVEHTVTEEVTGVDLVAASLRIAAGATLAELGLDGPPAVRGLAIQARVNAEVLDDDGAPTAGVGTLERFELPGGPGVRVDTHGHRGLRIGPRYDPLLAKVVAHGADLAQATARLRGALEEFTVEGVPTALDLLHGLVTDDDFQGAPWDTGYVADHLDALRDHHRPGATPLAEETADGTSAAVVVPEGDVAVVCRSPGVVLRVDVEPGASVGTGQTVVLVEAMKMEHAVRAPAALRVAAVGVAVGDVVAAGDVVAHGRPAEAGPTSAAGPVRGRQDRADADPADPDWSAAVAEIERRSALAHGMGGSDKVGRQHEAGKLDARARIAALADPGTFREIGALAGFPDGDDGVTPTNFVAGTARVDGRPVVLGVDDFTLRGGSGDAAIHAKQVFGEEYAREMRLPVVRLLDGASGGGSVKMAADAGYTYVPVNPGWDAVVENLSLVPVVAAALGPTVGLGAARLVMSHLAVLVEGIAQVFTAGPPVVAEATGERRTKEQLGGADVHRDNGVVERVVPDEAAALDVVRGFLSYLPRSVDAVPPVTTTDDPADRAEESLLSLVPQDPRRGYDVHELLAAVFDAGSVFVYAQYGGATVTALARLDGHPVGVVATDPEQGATLSAPGALALTRLVDLCETFHLPLVSLTDQAGMSIGTAAERAATLRHGARAITAVYQARIPQAELIVRRVYGVGGAGAINRHRASRSWAWPSGDWGSLPSRGGIEAAFRARLAAADDPAAELDRLATQLAAVASPFRTAEHFGVQDIVDPRHSRALLCEWVRDAYALLPSLVGPPSFGTRP